MNGNIKKLKEMPSEEEVFEVSQAMKDLGDPSRLRIFWLLCHYEECVSEIAGIVNMTSPAVCHHLRILKQGNLITSRRVGKEMYYTAKNTLHVEKLHATIEDIAKIRCP